MNMTTRRRKKVGDVYEMPIDDGWGYIHYIGVHEKFGEAILVCPGTWHQRPEIDATFFEDAFLTFYPIGAALWNKLVSKVGHILPPPMPDVMRRPGWREGRKVVTWIIMTPEGEVKRKVLSEAERKLPVAVIWNHEYLVDRIRESWSPEKWY